MRHEILFYYQIKVRVYGFYVAGTFKTYQTEQRKNNCKAFIFSLSRVGNSSLSGRQETTPPSPRRTGSLYYTTTALTFRFLFRQRSRWSRSLLSRRYSRYSSITRSRSMPPPLPPCLKSSDRLIAVPSKTSLSLSSAETNYRTTDRSLNIIAAHQLLYYNKYNAIVLLITVLQHE